MSLRIRFALATTWLLLGHSVSFAPASAPPPGLQSAPVLVGDGVPLAVWTDGRNPGHHSLYWTALATLGPAGAGSPVTGRTVSELHPALACTPRWGLLAWESVTSGGGREVRAGRVVPGPEPVLASDDAMNAAGFAQRPAVAVRGERGVVVWQDDRNGTGELFFTRWDRDDGALDPGGEPLSDGARYAATARVAATPWGFLAAWTERAEDDAVWLVLQRMDAQGNPYEGREERRLAAPTTVFLEAAARGAGAIVLWREPGVGGSDLKWCDVGSSHVG